MEILQKSSQRKILPILQNFSVITLIFISVKGKILTDLHQYLHLHMCLTYMWFSCKLAKICKFFPLQSADFRRSSIYCFMEICNFSPSYFFEILQIFLSVFKILFIFRTAVWNSLATQCCISIIARGLFRFFT